MLRRLTGEPTASAPPAVQRQTSGATGCAISGARWRVYTVKGHKVSDRIPVLCLKAKSCQPFRAAGLRPSPVLKLTHPLQSARAGGFVPCPPLSLPFVKVARHGFCPTSSSLSFEKAACRGGSYGPRPFSCSSFEKCAHRGL
jgi:hypothetical protein